MVCPKLTFRGPAPRGPRLVFSYVNTVYRLLTLALRHHLQRYRIPANRRSSRGLHYLLMFPFTLFFLSITASINISDRVLFQRYFCLQHASMLVNQTVPMNTNIEYLTFTHCHQRGKVRLRESSQNCVPIHGFWTQVLQYISPSFFARADLHAARNQGSKLVNFGHAKRTL